MVTRSRMAWGDGDPRHGTVNGYRNLGCRCDDCRTAWAAHNRQRRHERDLAPDDPRHGTNSAYTNHGCRCPACSAANTAERAAYRAKLRRSGGAS